MTAQKWYILGGFGYHGNLLVFFGFWFLVCRVSSFVRRYSELGLETPHSSCSIKSLLSLAVYSNSNFMMISAPVVLFFSKGTIRALMDDLSSISNGVLNLNLN